MEVRMAGPSMEHPGQSLARGCRYLRWATALTGSSEGIDASRTNNIYSGVDRSGRWPSCLVATAAEKGLSFYYYFDLFNGVSSRWFQYLVTMSCRATSCRATCHRTSAH